MARVWSSGFELNSTAANMEWTAAGTTSAIQSTVARSGTYALQSQLDANRNGLVATWAAAAVNKAYGRFYLRVDTLPSATNTIASFATSTNYTIGTGVNIQMTTSGALQLINRNASTNTQVGSDSAALSTGTWYRVELSYDGSPASGSRVIEAKIDGVTFATTSTSTAVNSGSGYNTFYLGANILSEGAATGNLYFDDVAINDTSGTSQTGYPGSGKIIHLRPNAAGDSAGFVRQGTDSGANFSQVNEVTPNDLTQYVNSATLNAEDMYEVDNSGIGASDTVNLVHVGGRFRTNTATSPSTFRFQIKKVSGGTITQSASITPSATTWVTNALAAPRTYPITLYADPDAGAWTQSTLDTMQIGMKVVTVPATARDDVSAVWALVDYTPAAAPPASATSATVTMMGV